MPVGAVEELELETSKPNCGQSFEESCAIATDVAKIAPRKSVGNARRTKIPPLILNAVIHHLPGSSINPEWRSSRSKAVHIRCLPLAQESERPPKVQYPRPFALNL